MRKKPQCRACRSRNVGERGSENKSIFRRAGVRYSGWLTTSPEAVLASGDRLVAIAAIPCRLEDLVEKYGDQVRTSPLEVADEDAACAAVQVAGGRVGELGACGGGEVYRADMPFLCVPKPWGVIEHSIHSNDRGGTP